MPQSPGARLGGGDLPKIDAQTKARRIDAVVAAKIRVRRIALSMSAEETAAAAELSPNRFALIEGGSTRIHAGHLIRIAAVLDARIGYFFDDIDPELPESRKTLS